MLSLEEKAEIDIELANSPNRQAASIEALKIIQRHRGWVSDEGISDLAEYLKFPASALEGTATYYNLIFRKRVGRHQIFLCDSMSCWVMGHENIRDIISNKLGVKLGETTSDDRFTLLPIVCLGVCEHAPAMMIDRDIYLDLTPAKIDEILESYK